MTAPSSTPEICGCSRPEACIDRHAGRYLTAVLDRGGRARTGQVSDRLAVSAASVTEMFGRLAADGFVEYEKRRGVELTGRGEAVARELAWRRCAVRAFFAAELDLGLPDATAYRIGYVLPDDGIERLRQLVGDRTCRRSGAEVDRCPFETAEN